MAQDGCQPMERFSFASNGSAQKSWASCPSSRLTNNGGGGGNGGPAGTYQTRPYSVSGYVNGYNPSLPAYPPTRAQLVAAAPNGGRDAVFVSAKIAPGEMADPAAACDALLAALKMTSLDLLSIEWPVGDAAELNACWSKLEALVDAGKVKAIGLTNASVPVVESICKSARVKPAVNEVEAHPLMAHRKLVGVCRRYGVTPAAFAPLGGLDDKLMKHPKLVEAAAVSGSRTVEELLVRWSVQRGVPFAIDASASAAAVAACADAHGFRLTNAQKVAIDAMEPPPREGGVRFVNKPEGLAFEFDDPFLGGVTRPGLDLEKQGLL